MLVLAWSRVEFSFNRATSFNFDEHIDVTLSNPLFLATIIVS
jgi:hypothetical protein